MVTLKNNILEKLANEGRISHMSTEEGYRIYNSTHKRMNKYKQTLAKREYYSHVLASETILNS
jgi:hypothetical protein